MHIFQTLAFATLFIGVAACSSHKTTVSADGTTVTTDDGDKSVTIKTKDGTETIGKDAVDLSKLGVPVYPNAEKNEGGFSMSGTGAGGGGQMVALSTTDAFDKVYDWYTSQVPKDAEKMKVRQGNEEMAEFTIGNGAGNNAGTTITISGKSDKTEILIMKAGK
jgi:hypothetical protein